jgi:putative endonuclease
MTKSRQDLGRWGESVAADYLSSQGYEIINRNVRTPYGEIDLITQQRTGDQSTFPLVVTVFVEVKTRSSKLFGSPEEAISRRKQNHMLSAAQSYLQQHSEVAGNWRIDVISVELSHSQETPVITHFENALSGD